MTPQPPWTTYGSYGRFLSANGLTHSMTYAEVWMFMAAAAHDWLVAGLNSDGEEWGTIYTAPGNIAGITALGNAPTPGMAHAVPGLAAATEYGYARLGFVGRAALGAVAAVAMHVTANDPTVSQAAWMHITTNFERARARFIDLVAATQVSALSEKNIENYYKAAGVEINAGPIGRVLGFLSPRVERLISLNSIQARAANFDWLRYHIAAASTAGLVRRFLDAVGVPLGIGPNTIATVTAALASPWDKALVDAIPQPLIGFAAIFLREVGQYPSNQWYKGDKAVSSLSVAQVDFMKRFASTWRAVAATAGINPAAPPQTMVALVAAVAASNLMPANILL